jgi:hypothetical protein
MADIVCVKIFGNRSDAEIAKSALAAEHIESYLDADDAGGMYPFPMSGHTKGVRLFIKNSDKVNAEKILKL